MTQPKNTVDRLEEGDSEMFSVAGHKVTTNEVHALQLSVIGLFGGLAFANDFVYFSLAMTIGLFLTAFGMVMLPESAKGKKIPIAWKTKRHEPWWFTSGYTIFFTIGTIVFSLI